MLVLLLLLLGSVLIVFVLVYSELSTYAMLRRIHASHSRALRLSPSCSRQWRICLLHVQCTHCIQYHGWVLERPPEHSCPMFNVRCSCMQERVCACCVCACVCVCVYVCCGVGESECSSTLCTNIWPRTKWMKWNGREKWNRSLWHEFYPAAAVRSLKHFSLSLCACMQYMWNGTCETQRATVEDYFIHEERSIRAGGRIACEHIYIHIVHIFEEMLFMLYNEMVFLVLDCATKPSHMLCNQTRWTTMLYYSLHSCACMLHALCAHIKLNQ